MLLETTVRPHQMLGVLFLGRMMMEVIVNPFTLIAARQMLVRLKDQIETIKGGATLVGSADLPQQKGRAR